MKRLLIFIFLLSALGASAQTKVILKVPGGGSPGGGTSTLAGATDAAISSPTAGQVLSYNGTKWANTNTATYNLTSPQNGDLLKYQDGQWVNFTPNYGAGSASNYDSIAVSGTTNKAGFLFNPSDTSLRVTWGGVTFSFKQNGGASTTTPPAGGGTETVLNNQWGIDTIQSGDGLGNSGAYSQLSYPEYTRIQASGTVNKLRMNLLSTPTGITSFYVKVWRKNGTSWDLVGTATVPTAGLVPGINTVTVSAPFAVQAGDWVGFGYDGTSTNMFMGYKLSPSGVQGSAYIMGVMSRTSVDWDSEGIFSRAYAAIQLIQ